MYLGFGAGLAVFIFTGVIKGIPQELEESAMIDGASVPRIFFQITLPIMRPSVISVAILQAMWIWNDFLLPYLTLDMRRFKTMSIAIQYLKGGYGSVDMGAMMGCLVLAIIPIIIFYLVCQKYIIKGVMLAPSRLTITSRRGASRIVPGSPPFVCALERDPNSLVSSVGSSLNDYPSVPLPRDGPLTRGAMQAGIGF